jgi:tripartite-type tricarboxylate transporter receptor subunit TctC
MRIGHRVASTALALMVGLLAGSAVAQDYPTKPVRIIVPFPPGQGADTLVRIVAERLTPALGQQVIVENRPGAGGTIGTEYVAKQARPDGYTLVMGASGPLTISQSLYPKIGYNSLKDLESVTLLSTVPQVFVVNPESEFKSVADLIKSAKANPGKIFYASSGKGTTQHLMVELFASRAGIKLTHVPYKGSAPAMTDLLGGQVPFLSDTIPAVLPMIKAGRVRPLGITSVERSPYLPDVPTIAEQGLSGFNTIGWIAIMAPAKTPKPILDRLDREFVQALKHPDVVKRMEDLAYTTKVLSRDKLHEFIADEIAQWSKVVQEADIKVE